MSDPTFRLDGRRIIVTGAAGLLGREFADALLAHGAAVALVDRDRARLEELQRSLDGPVEAHAGDITDEGWVTSTVARLGASGPVDGLINSAAIDPKMAGTDETHRTGFVATDVADFRAALEVNLTGMMLMSREAVAVMSTQGQRGRGVIVNVSSIYGLGGADQRLYDLPDRPAGHKPIAYPTTKAGVIGFTRALAATCAGTDIRVNALVPGGVRNRPDPLFEAAYGEKTMIGRMADPAEMRGPLVFLCSDASSYMTGAQLVVDGGWTAW